MHVQSLGAQLALKIIIEIGDIIRQAYLFNDSRVAIAWCNNVSNKPLNLFVANRVAIVKNTLQTAQETLYDTHLTEDIQSPIRQSSWKNDFFKDILHWSSSAHTVADRGTKYRRFGSPDSGPIITANQVNPDSCTIKGMPWMQKIDEEIRKGNLVSARTLGAGLEDASEAETKIYEAGFKKERAEKIQDHGHVILGKKLLPASAIHDGQQTATLLFSNASDLYQEEIIPETEESCLIEDVLDDATTIHLLGVVASGRDVPNELVKYVKKMKEIHETPCVIQIPSTSNQTDPQYTQIQHILSTEKTMKSKFSLSLRILFLVILASIKWKRSINQNLVLCRFKTDLTSGLLRPAKLESLLPMITEKPPTKESSHDWLRNLNPLPAFSGQGPAWQNICKAWDTCSNKSMLKTKQDLCFTNRDGDNRLSILYRKNTPSFIRRHPKMRFVIRKFSLIFNLIQIADFSDRTKGLQKVTSALIIMERLQSDFFVGKKGNSYLSCFILKDLTKCYKYLIGTPNLRSLFREVLENRNHWMPVDLLDKSLQFNPSASVFDQDTDKCSTISRNIPHNFSIIDFIQTELDFTESFRCLSIFLSHILSHELKLTFPSSFIRKITIQNAKLPGIYFLRSRFHNFRNDLSSHDKSYRDFLLSQGINPCPLVVSPFSSLAYSFTHEVHQMVPALPRQSTLGSHIGYTRIYLELEGVVRILQLKKLVKYIRKSCLQCKKQLQQTLPDHPGKAPEHRILKMNSFSSGIMIDLLPSIKIRTTTNQKSTRNATVLNCHILLGVDVATKFSSFVIINSRNSVDIQNGLSALCVKIGKKATTFFSDRESSIVSIAESTRWIKYSNGIFAGDVIIRFIPALAESHSRAGLVESRVGAIKRSLGSLDLGSFNLIDLNIFLEMLFCNLNSIPIYSKILASKKHMFDNIYTRNINPNQLQGRVPLFLLDSDSSEAMLEKRKLYTEMIDQVGWKTWVILNRDTDLLDQKVEKLKIGSIVLFRKTEKGFGPTNRFFLGVLVSISSPSSDGVSRSVYIQGYVEKDQIHDSPEENELPRLYIFHRKISDIILVENQEEELVREELLKPKPGRDSKETSSVPASHPREEEVQEERRIMTRNRKRTEGPALSVLLVLSKAELSAAMYPDTKLISEDVLSYYMLILLILLLIGGTASILLHHMVKMYSFHFPTTTDKNKENNSFLNISVFRSCSDFFTRSGATPSKNLFTMLLCIILHCNSTTLGFDKLSIPSRKQDILAWAVNQLIERHTKEIKRQFSTRVREIYQMSTNSAHGVNPSIYVIIFMACVCWKIPNIFKCFHTKQEDEPSDPYLNASAPPMEPEPRKKKRKAPKPPIKSDSSKKTTKKTASKSVSLPIFLVLCLTYDQTHAGRSMDMRHGNRYPFRTLSTTTTPTPPRQEYLLVVTEEIDATPSDPSTAAYEPLPELPEYEETPLEKSSVSDPFWNYLSRGKMVIITLITGVYALLCTNLCIVACCLLMCKNLIRRWKRRNLKRKTRKVNMPLKDSEVHSEPERQESIYLSMNRKKMNISRPINLHPWIPMTQHASIYDIPRDSGRSRFTEISPDQSGSALNADEIETCLPYPGDSYQRTSHPTNYSKTHVNKYQLITLSLISILLIPECAAYPNKPDIMNSLADDIMNSNGNSEMDEDITVLEVKKGAMINIHCTIQEIHLGKISWILLDKIEPPQSSQIGEVLILHKVNKPTRVKCIVEKQYKQYEQEFLIKVSTDHEDPTTAIPELIEAYSCSAADSNPIMRLSNAETKDCNKQDFKTYIEEAPSDFILVTRNRVKKVNVKQCSVFIHNKLATCQNQIAGGFRTIYKGNVPISTEDCLNLHQKGSLTLHLASDTIRFTKISIDHPAYEVMFLSNSSIDRSLPKNPCHVATKEAYFGPYIDPNTPYKYWDQITGNKFDYQSILEFVIMADIQVSIDLVPGVLNYEDKSLAIPRMGKVLKYDPKKKTTAWSSREFGEIVFEIPREKNSGFQLASNVVQGRIFIDNSSFPQKPNIAVLSVLNDTKIVALQVNSEVNILDRAMCKNTHVRDLFLCPDLLVGNDLEVNPELVQTLGSQPNLIQQINSAESTASILHHICLNRHAILSMSLNDFPTQGSSPFQLNKGIVLIDRGEESLIFQCKQVLVEPVLDELDFCTQELAVYIKVNEAKEIRYLTPRKRILIENPTVTMCNAEFPIRFYIDEHTSICQEGIGKSIQICSSPDLLDPAKGLAEARLKTLLQEENRLSATSLVSDMRQLVQSEILASNYHKSLDAAVIYNRRECAGDPFLCKKAYLQPANIRRELFRQSLSLVSFLLSSTVYQLLVLIGTMWSLVAICSGLFTLLIRLKNLCHRRTTKYHFCQLVISIISELDTALNPMSLTRQKFKQRYDLLTIEVQNQKAQIDALTQINQSLMTRMTALEQRFNDKKPDSQDTEPHYLSLPTTRKSYATIKKTIRPGILRRKKPKYVTFDATSLTELDTKPDLVFPPIPTEAELAGLDISGDSDENTSLLSDSIAGSEHVEEAEIHPDPFDVPTQRPRLIKREPLYPAPTLVIPERSATSLSKEEVQASREKALPHKQVKKS